MIASRDTFNGSVNSFQILNDGGCSIVLSEDDDEDTCDLLALLQARRSVFIYL